MNLLLFALVGVALCARRQFVDPITLKGNSAPPSNAAQQLTVGWFPVKLDQFTYSDTRTFNMKYLYQMDSYKTGGPIFFYTGNEGDIEGFASATGIMFDLAPQFNAAIIFAEHRFYGATLPFGNNSYASINNMGYLTSQQALADYAAFITELKNPSNKLPLKFSASTPVIAFGGSYGGMLSAWFRIKYPHIVTGSWASSAPLLYVRGGGIDQGVFDSITTRTYQESGCNNFIIQNAWNANLNLSSTPDGQAFLNSIYNLDPRTPIRNMTDGFNLNSFVREGIEYMAMVDYPYPTSFLEPMPGSPVQYACQYMNANGITFTDKQLAQMLANANQVYYNYTGKAAPFCIDYNQCGDAGTAALGSPLGWPWQECSEIIMDMCAKGMPNDFFWDECGADSFNDLVLGCQGIFGTFGWNTTVWNPDAVSIEYGLSMASTSNIILTQGHLDPWSGGGYKDGQRGAAQSRGIYAIEIPGSAHHLDLRTPNTCDPNTVNAARAQIVAIIQCWVAGCVVPPPFLPLPSLVPSSAPNCTDVNQGYPWGFIANPGVTYPPTTMATTTTVKTTKQPVHATTKTSSQLFAGLSLLLTTTFFSQ